MDFDITRGPFKNLWGFKVFVNIRSFIHSSFCFILCCTLVHVTLEVGPHAYLFDLQCTNWHSFTSLTVRVPRHLNTIIHDMRIYLHYMYIKALNAKVMHSWAFATKQLRERELMHKCPFWSRKSFPYKVTLYNRQQKREGERVALKMAISIL